MSVSKSTSVLIGTLAGVGMISAVAAMQPEPAGPFGERHRPFAGPQRMEMFVRGAASRLALDSAQEHELRVLLQRLGQARQSLAEERSKARASVLDLLAAPQLDQQTALQLLKDQSRAVETEAPAVIEAFSDFYDGLNDGQRDLLQDWIAARMYRSRIGTIL